MTREAVVRLTSERLGGGVFPRAAVVCLLLAACQRPALPPHPSDQTPKTRATVITMRTTLQPGNQTIAQTIAIAEGKARVSTDSDTWRLLDFTQKRVTFVDTIAKSSRTEPFASLVARRQKALAASPRDGAPRVQAGPTGARRTIAGVPSSEWILREGAYERHVWIGRHPSIPDDLFAMLQSSGAPPSSSPAGPARAAVEGLLRIPGFPMADHAELPYGKSRMMVDTVVLSVEQHDVPQSWFNVPPAERSATATATPSTVPATHH